MIEKTLRVLFLLLLCAPAWGIYDPLAVGVGARPIALGNAYVGLANDASGAFTNPAGVSEIEFPHYISMYSRSDNGTAFTLLGAAIPFLGESSLGLAYRNKSMANVFISTQESADYADQDIAFLLARKIGEKLSLGLNYRVISKGFSRLISGSEGANGSGSAFDFGIKYQPNSWLGIGVSLQGEGGKISLRDNSEQQIEPKTTVGCSFKTKPDLLVVVDLSKIADEPSACLHTGLEWRPVETFALRLGLDQTPKGGGENYNHLTAGFGTSWAGITLDYAFRRLGDPSQSIDHYFSLGYVGIPKKEKKAERLHFKDVPENHWAREPIEQLTSLGILNWYPDGTFKPENPVSRAEMAMLLVRAKQLKLPQEIKKVFRDVPADYWAAEYIQSAKENKLAFGYPDGTFGPRRPTTRMEGVVFAIRFADLKLSLSDVLESPFLDIRADHWGIKEVLAGASNRIIHRYLKESSLYPKRSLSRAELADILSRTEYIQQRIQEYFGKTTN